MPFLAPTNSPTTPWSHPDPQANVAGVDWSSLPRGLSLSADGIATRVRQHLQLAPGLVHRPLRAGEQRALAGHAARRFATESWGFPLSVLATAWFERRTRPGMGLPLVARREGGSADVFPSARRAWVQGPKARWLWGVARWTAWYVVCASLIETVVGSYALANYINRVRADPALREFNDDVSKVLTNVLNDGRAKRRMGRETGAREETKSSGGGMVWPEGGTEGADAPPQQQQQPSPSFGDGGYDDGLGNDAGFFDDASPVSMSEQRQQHQAKIDKFSWQPQQQQEEQHSESQSRGSSAWARLRAQARAGANSAEQKPPARAAAASQPSWSNRRQPQQQPTQSGDSDDGFAYSQPDANKSYAKEQAQKDFDAMLERERRGNSQD